MIICISANPALDRRVWLRSLRSGKIHRARAAAVASGGKAAHVAMVARSLGEAVLWIAMTGGATGDDCRCDLASMGIRTVTVKAQGVTRTNLELIEEESGQHTEIRETGDPVSASEVAEFVQCCREQLRNASGSCVVLSGSLPPGVSSDLYRRLIAEIHIFGSTALLDSSREALSAALEAEPDVIKPNQIEASEAVNQAIDDVLSAAAAAKGLRARGACGVALSLAEQGMVWATVLGCCMHTDRLSAAPQMLAAAIQCWRGLRWGCIAVLLAKRWCASRWHAARPTAMRRCPP
jgi:1-phosphofructokinase family hexose kinase